MRTEFLCVSVLRVASVPRVKLASCKSALNPPVVCSIDRSKAVVPVLVLLFVALWFILRSDLLYVFPCVILFLCFSVLLVLRLPRLGKRELILVLFIRLFGLCLFGFVGFLFLLGWEGLRFVIVALPGLFFYLFLIIKYGIYANIFAEKMWAAFAFAKATHISSAKSICELDIVLSRTVNILTSNVLVKLTMLWTTGPRKILKYVPQVYTKSERKSSKHL